MRLCATIVACLLATSAAAAELLEGEFGDVSLGRALIAPARFPTVRELRAAVAEPEIRTVMMLRLFGSGDNHHLPLYSPDGKRLAFQRSDLKAKTSHLLLFSDLGQAEPEMLSADPRHYDYMFRWCEGQPASYALIRIEADRAGGVVLVSQDGGAAQAKTPEGARRQYPSLYLRTDGAWRLLYEQDGRVMHQSWNAAGVVDQPISLAAGTSPRWSLFGQRFIYARDRGGPRTTSSYDIALRQIASGDEQLLPAGEVGTVRSPTLSPDEQHAAFYLRAPGEDKPWRIRICPLSREGGRTLAEEAVVNPDFDAEGPAWEPTGRRVWFFSPTHRQGAHFPLVAADVESGKTIVVDYPHGCTTPADLAINRSSDAPEMAFVAHDGLPKDVYVVLLNHY